MFLLDTNIVSELRENRPHGGVVTWLQGVDNSLIYLSALTLGELQSGVEITRRQDAEKAREIEGWVDKVAASYEILPMDTRTFREWARLMAGRSDELMEDAMIAATARIHRLMVVTRNIRDFEHFNVPLFDPFATK